MDHYLLLVVVVELVDLFFLLRSLEEEVFSEVVVSWVEQRCFLVVVLELDYQIVHVSLSQAEELMAGYLQSHRHTGIKSMYMYGI